MEYLLGIDVGTSGTKSVLVDREGKLQATASREYSISTPYPGWGEQDPFVWWLAVTETVQEIVQSANIIPREISAIGLSGQMHGTVFLDSELVPIRPAIIWADQRSQRQCRSIKKIIGEERLAEITCNTVSPGFMAASLLWVKENEPDNYRRLHQVLLPKDFIRFHLTGELATDVTDGSSTLLFDVVRRQWSEEIIDALGFDRNLFPSVGESQELGGYLTQEAARQLGLPKGIPVVLGGGDQSMQAVGNGVVFPGILSSTIGTGGQLFITVDRPIYDERLRLHTFCHALPGKWHLMGAMLAAGLSLRWLRDNIFKGSLSYTELEKEASLAPVGSEGLVFLPYLLGERTPHMNPQAKGVFFGLTLRHQRAHLVRAVMEGVTLGLRDSLEIIRSLGIEIKEAVVSGGGAKSKLWCQLQADILQVPLRVSETSEQAATGAALIAGVGIGLYSSVTEACNQTVRLSDISVHPNPENITLYERCYNIYRSLYQDLEKEFISG